VDNLLCLFVLLFQPHLLLSETANAGAGTGSGTERMFGRSA